MGIGVGVGGEIRLNDPHPRRKKTQLDIPTRNLFVIGSRLALSGPVLSRRTGIFEAQGDCFVRKYTFLAMTLKWMIQIPEDTQAFEGEPGSDDLDDVGLLRDDRGKAPGRNDLHFHPKLFAEPLDHSFHHAHIAE